ncbi:MAG TPA: low affinity iron permease family protein [Steroidobacteraceae bacterium]|jgi:low affinity Fe/Cu permease|nr:low affinity iron permease family protein [Steroidobacteraceae bacterium]
MRPTKTKSWFTCFAQWTARAAGRPLTFGLAVAVILVWGVSGPLFGFSDTWQLVINTGTTIVTFLMVFLIQNTQNRDSEAIQVKLDELIRVTAGAHVALLDLEELEDQELDELRKEYQELAAKARAALHKGKSDTNTPSIRARKRIR